jgi:hypothetical protein
MHRPQIKIFLADGSPTGLRTAELGLSTCKAVIAPRSNLTGLQARPEAKRTGVYILVGQDPDHAGREAIYVGEGDNVFTRIARHDKDESKEFWDYVTLFVSKDENLTKAHVRHLEGKLLALARDAKRCKIMNLTAPDPCALPEADLAEMDELLEHIQLLLGTLGVRAFQAMPAATERASAKAATSPALVLTMKGAGYSAECLFQDGTFTVRQGSKARVETVPSLNDWARSTRVALLDNGVLQQSGGYLVFTQDYGFEFASGAAGVISGSTVNGKTAWRLNDDRTFKQWEQARLEEAEVNESG